MISDKVLYEHINFEFHSEMKVRDVYLWNIKRLNWLVHRELNSGVRVSPIVRELAKSLNTSTRSTAQVVLNARLSAIRFWEVKIEALNNKGKSIEEISGVKRKSSSASVQKRR